MDDRHPSHQFLKAPPWAGDARPATRASGLDLSDLSGRIPAADVVRRAARNVSPLAVTRPSAWMLRRALAQAHEMGVGQIFPRLSLSHLLAPIVTTFLGPGDHVALAAPCRPEFLHHVLSVGARYVDIGRDQAWGVQADAFTRLIGDGQLSAVVLGRPAVPTGTLAPLELVRQALDAGLVVIVDETALAYADHSAGLPRAVTPRSDTALTLLQDDDSPTDGLIVLRSVPGLGAAQLVYAVADAPTTAQLWRIDPVADIPAPVAAGAWIALDHTAHARRIIASQCTVRAELRTAMHDLPGYSVTAVGGPGLLVARPGVDGDALRRALARAGLIVSHSPHHAWRDHVALCIPSDTVLDRVVDAFERAAAALEAH